MQWAQNDVKDAFDLFVHLLRSGKIEKRESTTLFQAYQRIEVKEIVAELIEERAGMKVFAIEDVIYMVPEMDNELFHYSNSELREKMKVKSNKELYLAYFALLVIISKFYNSQDQSLSTRSYVTMEELIATLDEKMVQLEELKNAYDDPDALADEYGIDADGMLEVWKSLPVYNEQAKKIELTNKNRVGFLIRVFRFMEEEELLVVRELREISITEKMKQIITNYYFNSERKEKIMDLLQNQLV